MASALEKKVDLAEWVLLGVLRELNAIYVLPDDADALAKHISRGLDGSWEKVFADDHTKGEG